jgi:transposase
VCIDLSPAFISGVEAYFPNAQITFDRFHVKALLNKAMDEVRKQERRRHVALKGHKYTFLKSPKQLTEAQSVQRPALIELYPQLGEAYRLKELFDDFWAMKTPQEARGFLAFWCDVAQESEITPFMGFVNTVKKHWDGIINYITSKLTNGILEGINSKIQLIKRRARGYRNTTNFINMIYFTCGKLQFDYPHRST